MILNFKKTNEDQFLKNTASCAFELTLSDIKNISRKDVDLAKGLVLVTWLALRYSFADVNFVNS